MRPPDVQHVCCPHCGWSFVTTGTLESGSTMRALRVHLESRHPIQACDPDRTGPLAAANTTPRP